MTQREVLAFIAGLFTCTARDWFERAIDQTGSLPVAFIAASLPGSIAVGWLIYIGLSRKSQ